MKFDSNGKKIYNPAGNKSLSTLFMERVMADVKVIAEHFDVKVPKVLLKNGDGGSYNKIRKDILIGFGDGVYRKIDREVVMHEMIHHAGYDHGKVMGHKFMSHHNNDFLSPILIKKVFGDVVA